MSYRRGGRSGGHGGGFTRAEVVPFEPYPEIADLGTAEFSTAHMQLIRWSTILHQNCDSSPFNCDDTISRPKRQKLDIERYSDRQSGAIRVRPALRDVIHLDSDHMPGELLAKGGERSVKKLKWAGGSDWGKWERIEKIAQKKEDEDEEEEEEGGEEDEGEFSDDGDYGEGEYVDDDEDDFNMPDEDGEDEGVY